MPTAHQIPSMPNTAGSKRSMAIWNMSVRRNEIAADTTPLLKAVKKEDLNRTQKNGAGSYGH